MRGGVWCNGIISKRLDFNGNSHVGIYCRTNNEIAFVEPMLPQDVLKDIEQSLRVKIIELTIGGSSIIGSLIAMNSNGIILTDFVNEDEIEIIKENFSENACRMKSSSNLMIYICDCLGLNRKQRTHH